MLKSLSTTNSKMSYKIRPLHVQAASHGVIGEIHSFDSLVDTRHHFPPLFLFLFSLFLLHPFIIIFLYNQREACIVRNKLSDSGKKYQTKLKIFATFRNRTPKSWVGVLLSDLELRALWLSTSLVSGLMTYSV